MKQHSIPLEADQVQVTDPLFGSYVRLVGEKLIPYQWEALNDRIPGTEPSHCIDNFRVAAGQMQGGHRGAIFQDTDLYKWLEAVAFCIQNGTGRQYIPIADEVIELIGQAQCEDGYLNTYITIEHPESRWKNLAEGHELYGCGHLIEAAVAYYKATGKRNLLDIAQKFADLVVQVFGPGEGRCQGYPGHQEIELALVKLYRVTGKKAYLELADSFIRRRGARPNYLVAEMKGRHGHNIFPEFYEYDEKYAQTHEPPLQQSTAEGHAVRAVYMYSAMADLALEEGDDEMRSACVRLYNNIVGRRMYITGGIGSSGKLERFTADYDLPNDRMYCESCASVGLMMFSQRMATLTGEADYYDTVERALCNTVLAGISKDGDRYFYVNPLEVWPDNILGLFGIDNIMFLSDSSYVVPSLAVIAVWLSGNLIVIFLAGLQNVPRVYHEAAEIDGANAWQRFVHVTVPCMTPIIFYNLLMSLITNMQVVTPALALTSGGPGNSSMFITYLMYRYAFKSNQIGYACAISFVFFILIAIFTAILFSTSNRWVYYEGSDAA